MVSPENGNRKPKPQPRKRGHPPDTPEWRTRGGATRKARTNDKIFGRLESQLLMWCKEQKPRRDWSFAELLRDADVHKTTLNRREINSLGQVAKIVVNRLDRRRAEVPDALRQAAVGSTEPHPWIREFLSGETKFTTTRGKQIEVALARHAKVKNSKDTLARMVSAAIVGHVLLAAAQREYRRDQTLLGLDSPMSDAVANMLEEVTGHCTTALMLVDHNDPHTLEAALRCVPVLVEAERLLSRRSFNSVRLQKIMAFKEKEAVYARALGLRVREEMALFNSRRAQALLDNDPTAEWDTLLTVGRRLNELHDEYETIPGADIEAVYQRYVAVRVAYDLAPSTAHIITFKELLRHHPAAPQGRQFRRNAKMLDLLTEFSGEYADLGGLAAQPTDVLALVSRYARPAKKPEREREAFRPTELMRAHQFAGVGHLLLARYFTAMWHGSRDHRGSWAPGTPEIVQASGTAPIQFLVRAVEYYELAFTNKRNEGAAGQLKRTAMSEHATLKQMADPFIQEVENASAQNLDGPRAIYRDPTIVVQQVLDAIDSLVLTTARWGATTTDAHRIFNALVHLHDFYLEGPPL